MISREQALRMPKVELHVHLEGSIRPETLLKLSERNHIPLPHDTVEGLREWYTFRDFRHFVEIYLSASKCVKTPEDVELIAREFLQGQKDQNVLHSEVTYTAATIEEYCGIPWPDQFAALQSAMAWGRDELGVSMGLILDIVRGAHSPERAEEVAGWAIEGHGRGVCALGLAGEEWRGTKQYTSAFAMAHEAGLPIATHAGETCGAEVIWECLEFAHPLRIGHGVRCLEDKALVDALCAQQIPLEVCPSSNVCLGVAPSLSEHPLGTLIAEGLYVTVNSDDPPMFNTTITDEFIRSSQAFNLGTDELYTLTYNAAAATFLPKQEKDKLISDVVEGWREVFGEA